MHAAGKMGKGLFAENFRIEAGNQRPGVGFKGKAHEGLIAQDILQRLPLFPAGKQRIKGRFFIRGQFPHFIHQQGKAG